MLLTGFMSVVITVIAKFFGSTFHPFQMMFFYCTGGALCLLPAILTRYGSGKQPFPADSVRWRYHLIRPLLEFSGFSLVFYSLLVLPLPMQTALTYTIPLFASLFAVFILRETITKRIVISLLVGLAGVCIVHNPFSTDLSSNITLGIAAVVASSAMFGLCTSLIKLSTATTPPLLIAFFMLGFTSIVSAPFAISVWTTPSSEHIGLLCLFALSVAIVQYAVSKAFTLSMVTRIIPLMYLNLIWASLFAYFLFDEMVEVRTIIGSLVIFGAVIMVSLPGRKRAVTADDTSLQR